MRPASGARGRGFQRDDAFAVVDVVIDVVAGAVMGVVVGVDSCFAPLPQPVVSKASATTATRANLAHGGNGLAP
jgi:hypothetical protein